MTLTGVVSLRSVLTVTSLVTVTSVVTMMSYVTVTTVLSVGSVVTVSSFRNGYDHVRLSPARFTFVGSEQKGWYFCYKTPAFG